MKTTKIMMSLFTSLLFSVVLGGLVGAATGIDPVAVGAGSFGLSFIPKPAGIFMALDVEVWKPWIVEELFKNNSFLNFAKNADEHVLQGKVVHIPQAGSASDVERNRTSLPASISKRTDTDITYALDEYTTNPRLIPNADKLLSYDKMNSAMGQDMRALKQLVADWMIYHWRPASGNLAATTGESVSASVGTGSRKAASLNDLAELQGKMDDQDVPDEGRYLLIPSRMLKGITDELSASDYRDFSAQMDAAKGIVGQLFGFNILKRSGVLITTSTGVTIREPGAATQNTDALCALAWQIDHVERAMGAVEMFEDQKNPQYYGDIYSMQLFMGGRKIQEDGRGVFGLYQATP